MWIFLIPILVAQVFADNCPSNDAIYPCYCSDSQEEDFGIIQCDAISMVDLKKVLSNTKGLKVSYNILSSRLQDIPSNLFEGQISTTIEFARCKIHSFGDRPFTGLESTLTSITIASSTDQKEKDLESFPLGHLKNLYSFDFTGNSFKKLGDEWFREGPVTLEAILLENNDIEELGDKAFASLDNLISLKLSQNKIVHVYRSMLPQPASTLVEIDLSTNNIQSLPEDIFKDMPALQQVEVQGNKLKTIPESTWGKVWDQLVYVYFDGVTCDQGIKWIFQKSSGETRELPELALGGWCEGGKHNGKNLQRLTPKDFE